jgi:hypothetical protein
MADLFNEVKQMSNLAAGEWRNVGHCVYDGRGQLIFEVEMYGDFRDAIIAKNIVKIYNTVQKNWGLSIVNDVIDAMEELQTETKIMISHIKEIDIRGVINAIFDTMNDAHRSLEKVIDAVRSGISIEGIETEAENVGEDINCLDIQIEALQTIDYKLDELNNGVQNVASCARFFLEKLKRMDGKNVQ